jgi:hypothetical protein
VPVLDRHGIKITAIGDTDDRLLYGPPTIFIAPVGTPAPTHDELADPDGPWELLHPRAPDFPPDG